MFYYVWKTGDLITGHLSTTKRLPSPAVAITKDDYKKLGFYAGEHYEDPNPPENMDEINYSDLAMAVRYGVNEI